MKNTTIKLCIGLTLAISTATHANWGNSAGMMPFGGQSFSQPMQSFGGSTPWAGQSYNQPRYQPRYNPYNRGNGGYGGGYQQAPQSMPFGGMGSMPFSGMSQPQQQYRQPQSSSFTCCWGDVFFCSWVCPYHILAEWGETLHKYLLHKRIIQRNHVFNDRFKYFFFALFLILSAVSGYSIFEVINTSALPAKTS